MWQIGRCLPPHYPMQLSESPSVFHSSPLSEGQRYTRCEGCRWSLPPFTPTCQHVPWRGCDSNLSFHVPPLMSEKFCRAQPLLLTLSQSFLRSPTHSSLCRGSGVAKTRERSSVAQSPCRRETAALWKIRREDWCLGVSTAMRRNPCRHVLSSFPSPL